ncbi:MAG TPA: hypothetical protein VJI13_03855 [Candidatus Norongarragalinales archaeon]|nr:hypothetical protein [Candidatus Norongarragalinales archaeon]
MINVMGWRVREERLNLAGAVLLMVGILTVFTPSTSAFGFICILVGEFLFLRYS